jgi:RNA-directed DNA polymerase
VTYTRYADDLAFSAKRTGYLTGVERVLRRTIREIKSPSLTINENKTVLATRKYRRMVTGLILTNDGTVSLGHDRKRAIRAALHHAEQGRLTIPEQAHLAGLLAFVQGVEPEFFTRLVARYGAELIGAVKASTTSS